MSARDSIIRHRINVQRFMRGEVAATMKVLGVEDARLVTMLRERLPHTKVGDIGGKRLKNLMRSAYEMRAETFSTTRTEVRRRLLAFAKVEGQATGRIVGAAIDNAVSFNPIRMETVREAVTKNPFSGGRNAARTLSQWFDDLKRADQRRLLGAIQLGVHAQESTDTIVRRIAGTRANKYQDGILAMTRRDAEVAVRTAVNHTANAAQIAWGEANKDVVLGFEWSSMLDDRQCDECEGLNGSFVPVGDNDPPDGMAVANQTPPAHPQCRCTLLPVFDIDGVADRVSDGDGAEVAETLRAGPRSIEDIEAANELVIVQEREPERSEPIPKRRR